MRTFRYDWRRSNYLHRGLLALIDRTSVRTILELGAHDGSDTIELFKHFDADIHAFECHPDIIPLARERYHACPRIRLVEKAVWDADTRTPFYPVIRTTQNGQLLDNPGASSCFLARDDYHQRYEQSVTEVEAMRLDGYCATHGLTRIDLICMDVQGAALHALRGLGDGLRNVRYIIAELEKRPLYRGQALYPEVAAHLAAHGFCPVAEVIRDDWFSDFLFIKNTGQSPRMSLWKSLDVRLRTLVAR